MYDSPKVETLPALRERATMSTKVGFTDSASFDLAQRVAKALASSTLVPAQFQSNVPNCLIALEMAQRIGASPLLVAQNLYIVQGRPSWSAKFLIATFNQSGRYSSIRYEWRGTEGKKDRACRAWAIEKATGDRVESAWVTWELVEAEGWSKKNGSKWLTMPEQMFMYRSAAWLVNTHAPEISMGLNTADELADTYEAVRDEGGAYTVETVKERVEQQIEAKAATTDTPSTDEVVLEWGKSEAAMKYPDIIGELEQMQDMASFVRYMGNLPAKLKKELNNELAYTQERIRALTCDAPTESA